MVTSVTDISDTKETTMKVFVTGATGFIGSAIVRELLEAGHEVTGLARSESSAEALERAGAQTHRGTLEDVDSLRAGAAAADGVIHTAFIHDFTRHDESAEIDRRAVAAFIDTLAGSDRRSSSPPVRRSSPGRSSPRKIGPVPRRRPHARRPSS
jgi:uncharacterized protein YbjT (DUF2867 family)